MWHQFMKKVWILLKMYLWILIVHKIQLILYKVYQIGNLNMKVQVIHYKMLQMQMDYYIMLYVINFQFLQVD